MDDANGIPITIFFEKHGFFLTDSQISVWFDDTPCFVGSFMNGFETTLSISPGTHMVKTVIQLGAIQRTKHFTVVIEPANGYRIGLEYSRFWGNFKGALRVSSY